MKRRKFIEKSALGMLGASVLTGLYTWQVEPFWLEFVRRKMPIKNLPSHLIGKTVIQISDIHIGNEFNFQFVKSSLEKAKALKPDIVVYTGDFMSYKSEKTFDDLREVMDSAVKGSIETLAILGNHDYGEKWNDPTKATRVVSELKRLGIKVLRNSSHSVQGLNFLGIDDYWSPNFYPEKVMQKYNHEKANVVLCHNPDVCDLDVWNGYQGWILSGHTHGGQCKPPFLKAPILPVKNKNYSSGEIDLKDGRMLYINRALGHSLQVRFNVRPEITVFELETG